MEAPPSAPPVPTVHRAPGRPRRARGTAAGQCGAQRGGHAGGPRAARGGDGGGRAHPAVRVGGRRGPGDTGHPHQRQRGVWFVCSETDITDRDTYWRRTAATTCTHGVRSVWNTSALAGTTPRQTLCSGYYTTRVCPRAPTVRITTVSLREPRVGDGRTRVPTTDTGSRTQGGQSARTDTWICQVRGSRHIQVQTEGDRGTADSAIRPAVHARRRDARHPVRSGQSGWSVTKKKWVTRFSDCPGSQLPRHTLPIGHRLPVGNRTPAVYDHGPNMGVRPQ